jgi:beta-phosphoglucomutase-like phosphatase (HAD superfamily)
MPPDIRAVIFDMDGLMLDTELDRFRARWLGLWQEAVAANGIQQKPGLPEFLAFLETQRLPLAVATSSETEYAAFSLRQAGSGHLSRGRSSPGSAAGGVRGTRGLRGWRIGRESRLVADSVSR